MKKLSNNILFQLLGSLCWIFLLIKYSTLGSIPMIVLSAVGLILNTVSIFLLMYKEGKLYDV